MNPIGRLRSGRSLGAGLGAAVLACAVLPAVLPPYWIYLAISAAVSAVVMQSFGVIVGRAGVMSLCQMSFAAIGAWVVLKLNVMGAPGGFFAWLLLGGLAAVPVGVAIGLPALRIRGVNLAVVTFGFAVSADIVWNANPFPGAADLTMLDRPAPFDTDGGYFVLCVIVFTVLAVALRAIGRTRLGLSWYELRHSERSAAAHGVSVARSKLAAFAISAFVAGIGGGLLAGQLSMVVPGNFAMGQSLALFAVAVMIGPHHPEGAVLGGVFGAVMATIMDKLSLPQDFGGVLFGAGALLALRSGLSQTDMTRMRKRERDARGLLDATGGARPGDAPGGPGGPGPVTVPAPRPSGDPRVPALKVSGLTVRFGEVVALDAVDLTVPEGAVAGLIGPNGAGKSTFIAAATGFVAGYEGSVELAGVPLDRLGPSARAKRGLRRTFQTTAIAPELSLYEYLTIGSGRRLPRAEADELLEFFGCPPGDVPVSVVDAGSRRLLDVAAAIAAKPEVALLDEPAAGQSAAESLALGRRLTEVPARFGVSILLVEHDMELVQATCAQVTVLDFGHVIASGPTAAVLEDPAVRAAYLGTADVPAS
ncbi:branched-chain amino acid ABC transporter ATP-binding protein/permease [Actinomadura montaniterrae]|uniref:Branched-chain amino acid ABC transporter ATP-binding protein/permease n=1 Tax=Actinomadura montaniterrae TaxID=1803903 RepID=A0A6L3VMX5_9ACTN|nr:ATP-binding cassette domain-containing protein [Actinomadura montaniterrae]KAB2371800.1 branched-chain amino acid ABC transporter ATP-binding protein/permease [Actinomadura montaniterrae]